ncbi:hypothetical protein, partial [Streptomyces thermoalcalitolerans]
MQWDNRYLDIFFGAIYTVGAAVGLGLAEVSLIGYDLMAVATTISGYEIPYHAVMSVLGLGGAAALNMPSWSRLDPVRRGLIIIALAMLALSVLAPGS